MRPDPRPPRVRRPRPHTARSDRQEEPPARESRTREGPPSAGAPQTSRPHVRARPGAFDEDTVLRLIAADHYELHRLVYEALAHVGERDFLFAPAAVRARARRVLVRPFRIETRFRVGQRFDMRLRALPTVKYESRRRSIGAAPAKDPLRLRWIRARARENGFRLLDEPEMTVERVRIPKPGHTFAFNACLYRAPIAVADPVRFTRAYTRGIGQGRAWGCAMVILTEPGAQR